MVLFDNERHSHSVVLQAAPPSSMASPRHCQQTTWHSLATLLLRLLSLQWNLIGQSLALPVVLMPQVSVHLVMHVCLCGRTCKPSQGAFTFSSNQITLFKMPFPKATVASRRQTKPLLAVKDASCFQLKSKQGCQCYSCQLDESAVPSSLKGKTHDALVWCADRAEKMLYHAVYVCCVVYAAGGSIPLPQDSAAGATAANGTADDTRQAVKSSATSSIVHKLAITAAVVLAAAMAL